MSTSPDTTTDWVGDLGHLALADSALGELPSDTLRMLAQTPGRTDPLTDSIG